MQDDGGRADRCRSPALEELQTVQAFIWEKLADLVWIPNTMPKTATFLATFALYFPNFSTLDPEQQAQVGGGATRGLELTIDTNQVGWS